MAWTKSLEARLAAIEATQDDILVALRGNAKPTNVPPNAVGAVTVETVETVNAEKAKLPRRGG